MWKLQKKPLLVVTIILGTIAGILFQQVNWDFIIQGDEILKELHLPVLFLFLGLFYLNAYIRKIK